MAAEFKVEELFDGTTAFPQGINSDVPPLLLNREQASFAINTTFRGAFATDRPPFDDVTISWPSDEVKTAVERGLFQGACWYRPDVGEASLFAAISGRCFQFQLSGSGATVIERTIPGDPNPDTTTQAWLWQAENYVIWNDGVSLPVFMDAATSRRSDGQSQSLQLTSVDWTIPALGSSVSVTLAAAYTGAFNRPIWVDDVLYQAVENANDSYNVLLTNITATPGGTIAAGEAVTSEPVKLGLLTAPTVFNIISGSFAVNTLQLNFDISLPYTGALPKDILISGNIWRVISTLNGGTRLIARNRYTVSAPGVNYPTGTLVQLASSPAPNVSLGTVVTPFVIPAQGTTVSAELTIAYSGAADASVWIDDQQYTIETVPPAVPGATIRLINLTDSSTGSRGPTGSEGVGQLATVDELPPGRMGAYGMGRNVMSLVDGQSYIISDIVGGQAGTPANNYRDSVLKITENTYELAGGTFRVPGAMGDIRAIVFPAVLDNSFGQGPAQILTPDRAFSFNAPLDRTDWVVVTNPIVSQSLIANGALGQNSTITVDGDIEFRAVDGWRSLIFGRRQFTDAGGNTPMSTEVERVLTGDNIELLSYGSAVYFDNRVLYTASPQESAQGVIHPSIIALNKDPLASLRQKLPALYDGLWTGLNVLQLIAGKSQGRDRCFAFSLNVNQEKIELYELLPTGENHFDNGSIPICWPLEGPGMFLEEPNKRRYKQLADGEIQVDDVQGTVFFQVFYKPDQWPCWVPWHNWSICTLTGEGTQPGFYPRMGFGEPAPDACDSFTNRPFREGYTFQVKVVVTGHCRILAINLRAVTKPEPKMAPMICAACES